MKIFELLNVDSSYLLALLLNLVVAFLLLISIKHISGLIANVNATDELKEKDNTAFGISIFGVMIAIAIMMTGVVSGKSDESMLGELLAVVSYGVLGLLLMSITKFVFDKITMPNISVRGEINKGNIAVAIIDAGNVIATAIIIRSIMIWIEMDTLDGIIFVCIGYIISQIILLLATIYRKNSYNNKSDKKIHDALLGGNIALAFRFSGYRIAVAFVITSASGLVPFDTENILVISLLWIIVSFVMIVFIGVLSMIADKIIMKGIDNKKEISEQSNIAVGLIDGGIYVCLGIILASLTG